LVRDAAGFAGLGRVLRVPTALGRLDSAADHVGRGRAQREEVPVGEAVRVGNELVDAAALQQRLERSVQALRVMIDYGVFDSAADTCGFEVELDLVDSLGRPRPVNPAVLTALDRPDVQSELALFNIEFNAPARPARGPLLRHLDDELAATIDVLSAVAETRGARLVSIGTLPTLHATDLTAAQLSLNPRYRLLDQRMAVIRRRPVHVDIRGRDHLQLETESIGVQAAATSLQVHLRVLPADYSRYFNAAQALSPALVAATGNSPYVLGCRLWQESRIPLIEQSLDIRPTRGHAEEPPRVWMGDGWTSGALDVLEDNVRRYRPLIELLEDEDPLDELAAGRVPALHELRLHNGTIWRWNRPVYDVQHHHPHLRIESRLMPSGPTACDMTANSALFLGLVRTLADADPAIEAVLDFQQVTTDLQRAARLGLGATLRWAAGGRTAARRADRLLLDVLLPAAAAGLHAWGIDRADVDHYLGVVERRVASGRTGAAWQTAAMDALTERGVDRESALREMVRRYVENARARAPVHLWP
jgi:gamma-glutamyl:cysteine ligase YbdK (ATP-grasp superfamily)